LKRAGGRKAERDGSPGKRLVMAARILTKGRRRYGGMYIAAKSSEDKEVVTAGPDLVSVHRAARRKGVEEPVLFYVPRKGRAHIN